MRVIDLDHGVTLQAANDDDLAKAVREHYERNRPDDRLSDDEIRQLIADHAYEATDS
jgi:hypothetical protein